MHRLLDVRTAALASVLVAAALAPAGAQTPVIDTWAGTLPDNLPATTISLPQPNSVAVDASGSYYVASSYTGFIYRLSPAGVLSVFGGGGTLFGTAADGGPATDAVLEGTAFLAMQGDHLYFLASPGVRRIDTVTGTIETVVGGGPSPFSNGMLASQWDSPCATGLAVSPSAELYLSDECDHTLKRVDATGHVWIVAGQAGVSGLAGDGARASLATFNRPGALALSPSGDLAVIDQGQRTESRRVRRIAAGADGVVTGAADEIVASLTAGGCCSIDASWDGSPALAADMRGVRALGFDVAGDVLVSQSYEGPALLWRIDAAGILHIVAGADGILTPFPGPPDYGDGGSALAAGFGSIQGILTTPTALVLADDVVHAVRAIDDASGLVARLAGNGLLSYSGDGGPARQAQLWEPSAVAFDVSGNGYIIDQRYRALRVVDASTRLITTIAPAPPFDFRPEAVAINPLNRRVYFANGDDRIWAFDQGTGTAFPVAGTGVRTGSWDGEGGDPIDDLGDGGPALAATLNAPTSLAFDANANLYFADYANHRVRRIDAATGTILTVAGNGTGGFSGDGLARSASLNYPRSIALGPGGYLYVADSRNNRVRRVTPGADGEVKGAADEALVTLAVTASYENPLGIAVDAASRVFFSIDAQGDVRMWNAGSVTTYTGLTNAILPPRGDGGPAVDGRLARPEGLAVDPLGNLYIADRMDDRVRVVYPQAPNQPPVADSLAVTTAFGQPVAVTLSGTDPENAPLTYAVTTPPASGTLSGSPPNLTYTPDPGFFGTDSFTFTVDDGQLTSAPGTFKITVDPPAPPNLQLAKLALDGGLPVASVTVADGALLVFELSVVNSAPAGEPASGPTTGDISVVDELPVGLVFDAGASDQRCTAAGPQVTCVDSGPIASGSGTTFTIATRVGPGAAGIGQSVTVVNLARVSTPGDSKPADDASAPVVITIQGPPGVPTPIGTNVTVQLTDPNGNPQPVSLTFPAVVGSGYSTATPTPVAPPPNFQLNGVTYEIATTAQYTPPVTICFTGSFAASDRILHLESGVWVELPNQQLLPPSGPPFTTICAETSSFSPFAVASPVAGTGPAATITTPADGAVYVLGQAVSASYSCADGSAAAASCVGPVPSGSALDTASVGEKVFSVTATDAAGRSATETHHYRVVYAPSGRCLWEPGHAILRPIEADGSSVFRRGRDVPARFRVCDAEGRSIGTPGVVTGFRLVQAVLDSVAEPRDEPVRSDSRHPGFRWDRRGRQWVFNVDTDHYAAGSYAFRIELADGSSIDFGFRLVGRRHQERESHDAEDREREHR